MEKGMEKGMEKHDVDGKTIITIKFNTYKKQFIIMIWLAILCRYQ
jgi:hypothetical protein